MLNLVSKLGQIGPKWDKSGTFKDLFQYVLARKLDIAAEAARVVYCAVP